MKLNQTEKNDLIIYALSFLSANIDEMVEDDLEIGEYEIEARLRYIIEEIDLPNE